MLRHPKTDEALSQFLAARNVTVAPGEDITEKASQLAADLLAKAAAERSKYVSDPKELAEQLLLFDVGVKGLRKNPFKSPDAAATAAADAAANAAATAAAGAAGTSTEY